MTLTIEQLQIKNEVIANYDAYAQGLDSKDWPMVRSCFADTVYIDYGSISAPTGAPDVPRRADDWLPILQGVINGFDITRHAITNHRVRFEGDKVSCTAYLCADHVMFNNPELPVATAEEIVTVVGEYTNSYELIDGVWKIVHSQLVVNYSTGNVALLGRAMERAAALAAG